VAVDSEESQDSQLEDLRKFLGVYGIKKEEAWDELYSDFNTVGRLFEDFFRGLGDEDKHQELYKEFMEDAAELLDERYEVDPNNVSDASIYCLNQEPSRQEFKQVVKEVIEEGNDWQEYAEIYILS
jgi:hypothetical protein